MDEQERLLEAIDAAASWMDVAGVHLIGAGEDDGRPCLVVHASPPLERLKVDIPSTFHGFKVLLIEDTPPTA